MKIIAGSQKALQNSKVRKGIKHGINDKHKHKQCTSQSLKNTQSTKKIKLSGFQDLY